MSHSIAVDWPGELVAVVTFTDPVRGNQICWAAIDALGDQLRECREDGAKVVVLASGLEGHWLEHAWLQDLINGVQGLEQTGTGAGWFNALEELAHEDVISIAAISGDCSGGGAELGWACDIRVAESPACFSQPEVTMGITTGIGGSSRLAQLAGRATATEMVLTGAAVTAQRLFELGAITRVVPAGQSLATAIALAKELAQRSPVAVSGLKQILANSENAPLVEAMRREQEIFQSVVTTEHAITGMQKVQSAYDNTSSSADTGDDQDLH